MINMLWLIILMIYLVFTHFNLINMRYLQLFYEKTYLRRLRTGAHKWAAKILQWVVAVFCFTA